MCASKGYVSDRILFRVGGPAGPFLKLFKIQKEYYRKGCQYISKKYELEIRQTIITVVVTCFLEARDPHRSDLVTEWS